MYKGEKNFREKLQVLGILNPVIRNKDGILYAEPDPLSYRNWKASYDHDNNQKFTFEEFRKK